MSDPRRPHLATSVSTSRVLSLRQWSHRRDTAIPAPIRPLMATSISTSRVVSSRQRSQRRDAATSAPFKPLLATSVSTSRVLSLRQWSQRRDTATPAPIRPLFATSVSTSRVASSRQCSQRRDTATSAPIRPFSATSVSTSRVRSSRQWSASSEAAKSDPICPAVAKSCNIVRVRSSGNVIANKEIASLRSRRPLKFSILKTSNFRITSSAVRAAPGVFNCLTHAQASSRFTFRIASRVLPKVRTFVSTIAHVNMITSVQVESVACATSLSRSWSGLSLYAETALYMLRAQKYSRKVRCANPYDIPPK